MSKIKEEIEVEQLEKLKRELAIRIREEKLQAEIDEMKARLDPKHDQNKSSLKAWLKENNLWRTFILCFLGIVTAEIGYLFLPWPLEGAGVLMIILGIVIAPPVRAFVGDILR